MNLSLVVPAYNEAGVVGDSVRRIDAFLRSQRREHGFAYEIVVGDDGSDDETAAEVRDLELDSVRIVRRPHRGKGAILTDALAATGGTVAGFIDADLEIDITYLPDFLDAMEAGFDVAIASKTLDPVMNRHRPLSRRMTTAVFNLLVRRLLGSPITDHQAGFKLFRGSLIRSLLPSIQNEGWLWDTEVLVRCLRERHSIKEIPVEAVRRREGHVNVVTTSWAMLRDMGRLYLSMGGSGVGTSRTVTSSVPDSGEGIGDRARRDLS